jgi:16S rRNA (guanine527-N7)-methyltransferase
MQSELIREISALCGKLSIQLNTIQLREFQVHAALLEAWSRSVNLTAIRDPREIASRHFMEGIVAGELIRRKGATGPLLDLGSGNGFPGVPMGVICRETRPLLLVESSEKRAGFLRALIRDLGWIDARVEVRRVTQASDLADLPCRVFTSRGVVIDRLFQEGFPFLEAGGWCALFASKAGFQAGASLSSEKLALEAEFQFPGRESGILLFRKT